MTTESSSPEEIAELEKSEFFTSGNYKLFLSRLSLNLYRTYKIEQDVIEETKVDYYQFKGKFKNNQLTLKHLDPDDWESYSGIYEKVG
ncbi:hypothetical protein [Aliikangiella sp. G2MR2-5]|uniref:hypothetical protein n=1 Tax=Aliikangiella sp. G2MR2-5 TaxID=2788943 RepID=UPI0018A8CFFD|nr:hypothetical protein [Aliikangiella sp. G2MR2-5]